MFKRSFSHAGINNFSSSVNKNPEVFAQIKLYDIFFFKPLLLFWKRRLYYHFNQQSESDFIFRRIYKDELVVNKTSSTNEKYTICYFLLRWPLYNNVNMFPSFHDFNTHAKFLINRSKINFDGAGGKGLILEYITSIR